jgi:uridine phosphorylase
LTDKELKTTPLLGLLPSDISPVILLVFGEESGTVRRILTDMDCELSEVARRRESTTYRVKRGSADFLVVMGGYGSSSIASALHELVILGCRRFVMAGTCGGSSHHSLGKVYLIKRASINPVGGSGGMGFYRQFKPGEEFSPSPMLLEAARPLRLEPNPSLLISSDAFYGFGGVLNQDKKLSYNGPPTDIGVTPPGFESFKELYKSGQPFLLDMETAFFYGICDSWNKVEGIAIRAVSNYIPFDPEDPIPEEENALEAALVESVELVELLLGSGQWYWSRR